MEERKYRLVLEIFPGADSVYARITDGFNIQLRGSVPVSRISELIRRSRKAGSKEALFRLAGKFGLTPPLR